MSQTFVGAQKYGMSRIQLVGTDTSAASVGAVTPGGTAAKVSLDNPMVWLVAVGAVTLGLVAFSTHVRIGKFNASVSA